jgi:RNase P subunit RPR2
MTDTPSSLTAQQQAELNAAQAILMGGVDRRKFFHLRTSQRRSICRACGEFTQPGDPVVHCNGNRESVILCMPCVQALGSVINSEDFQELLS